MAEVINTPMILMNGGMPAPAFNGLATFELMPSTLSGVAFSVAVKHAVQRSGPVPLLSRHKTSPFRHRGYNSEYQAIFVGRPVVTITEGT